LRFYGSPLQDYGGVLHSRAHSLVS